MARYSNVQTNFSGGLITDNLAGRTDLARTANSCRKLENFLPTLQGPATYRRGFEQHVVDTNNTESDVVQTTVVLATDNKYRVVFGNLEAKVYDTDGTLKDTVVTPYSRNELRDLRFSSETDILYIAHPTHRPRYLQADIVYEFQDLIDDNGEYLLDSDLNQLRAAVAISGDNSWSLTEIDTFIEPFLEDDVSTTRMSITKGEEIVKVVSTAGDFSSIYSDYSGGTPNTFSQDWYVEYTVKGIKLLGKVIDSSTNYPEVTGPSADGTTVYLDAVDAVTTIEDDAAKLYLLDSEEAVAADQAKLEEDGVPTGEVHLRSDTAVFSSAQVNSFIRVPNSRQSDQIVAGQTRTTSRWVKVAEYLGTEAHPVEFFRGTDCGDYTNYVYGNVYRSYHTEGFQVLDGSNNTTGKVVASGNRTFSWTGGTLSDASNSNQAHSFVVSSVIGNLSTGKTMDVVKCDESLKIETGDNLIVPVGTTTATEIANDVQVTTSASFFDPEQSVGRYIKGKLPTGVVYMKILEWDNSSQVRALLRSPVPTTSTQEYENSGVFNSFAMGAWFENNYPRTVAKYERRRFYGGTYTHPNFLFVSKLGDDTSFAPTEDDGQVLDTNGFTYPLGNVNASIRWTLAAEELIIGTTQGIFRIAPNQYEAAISPKTVRISLADDVNCKGEAVMLGTSVFFPDESGTRLMEYKFDQNIQRFNANDLAKFIYPTFPLDPIKKIAIQEAPQARVWVLTESGILYTMVYQRQEDYYAWAKVTTFKNNRIDLATIHDITVVREGYASGQDMVVVAVNRVDDIVSYDVLNDESTSGTDAVFLDSSQTFDIAPSGASYDANQGDMLIDPSILINMQYRDSTVTAFPDVVLDGVYYGTVNPNGTYIRIPMQNSSTPIRVVFGYRYTGTIQPMYPTWDGANKPSFGTDEIRVVSSRLYLISSSTYKYGVGDNKETIELEGFVSTDDKTADASKKQVQFTGFDREKPVAGSHFGVDKIPEIVQDTPNELTVAALITKTDLN